MFATLRSLVGVYELGSVSFILAVFQDFAPKEFIKTYLHANLPYSFTVPRYVGHMWKEQKHSVENQPL